jgi:hypothetical protein
MVANMAGDESYQSNSNGLENFVVNNQGNVSKHLNVASPQKGHKPQLAKLGSKLAVNSGPKNTGRNLQAAGLGLIGVSGIEKVD